jgi:ANTAR domain
MPIDPSMLAKSIGTLTDLHPDQDLAATLQQAVQAAKQLFDADAAGVMLVDIDGSLRWASASDQRAQVSEDNQEVFAAGPAWRRSPLVGRRSCTTPMPGWWPTCSGRRPRPSCGCGGRAAPGRLGFPGADRASQGALMERERLDDQEAFTHLRRAARSSGRKLTEVAREVAAGQPLPRIRTRPSRTRPEQADGEADTP